MLSKLTLKIKLEGYLRNDFFWCSGQLQCSGQSSAQFPFAQIVYVPQSLVPGIWQNPLPLTGLAHSDTVDTKHETMKSVNRVM